MLNIDTVHFRRVKVKRNHVINQMEDEPCSVQGNTVFFVQSNFAGCPNSPRISHHRSRQLRRLLPLA
ncbi:hypothetical protein ACN47E_005204 [Coniothyrium glycines]